MYKVSLYSTANISLLHATTAYQVIFLLRWWCITEGLPADEFTYCLLLDCVKVAFQILLAFSIWVVE